MAYLMHIGFDNSDRLWKNVFYFEYKGVRYKLIQNNIRKWCDVLLTIIPDHNDREAIDIAFMNASEFISAWGWENHARVKAYHLGGCGVPSNFQLRQAKCRIFDFPHVPFGGRTIGNNINQIPKIETEEQREALTLFREASSSNNEFLAFLFFWQVLEVGKNEPIGWIDKTYRRSRDRLLIYKDNLDRLPLNGRSLGHYLHDDCRNAIAHIIKRKAGKIKLSLDNPADITRIAISTRVIEEFARFYIEHQLKLQKSMCLVRKNIRGFPIFFDEEYIMRNPCELAYRRPRINLFPKKKSY